MISVDRYIICSYPLFYTATQQHKHTLLKIGAVWVVSVLIAGPLFLVSMLDTDTNIR